MKKKTARAALVEARASVRADILLDINDTPTQLLERITKTLDALIAKAS